MYNIPKNQPGWIAQKVSSMKFPMNLVVSRGSLVTVAFIFCLALNTEGQDLYRTPSGEKYHLASCRMVINVSKKLLNEDDLSKSSLQPCKICNPPARQALVNSYSGKNKAVGESNSVQCQGYTKAGARCEHRTSIANGYCYQHTSQYKANPLQNNLKGQQGISPICGAKTKSGGVCQRKVAGGGRCYQH